MTLTHYRSTPQIAARTTSPRWRLSQLVTLVFTWLLRARMRRELLQLGDEQLRDVGLTREMIRREAEKSFWMM